MRIALRAVVVVAIFAIGIYVGKLIFRQGSTVPAPAPTYFNQSAAQGDSIGVGAGTITGKTIDVKPGKSIQEAVGMAASGDIIRIYPGVYNETVYIDKDNISLQGVIVNGEWPTLDGKKTMNDAILYSG